MIAAQNSLYLATIDGRIVCLAGDLGMAVSAKTNEIGAKED